jgi:hypothetical protein
MFGTSFSQVGDNGGVGVEEIVSSHTWFSWDTGWDDDQIDIFQAVSDLIVTFESGTVGWSVAVRQISGDTWSGGDIVKSEVVNVWVGFEEKREWLTDSSGGTENGDVSSVSDGSEGSTDHIARRRRKVGFGRVSVSST